MPGRAIPSRAWTAPGATGPAAPADSAADPQSVPCSLLNKCGSNPLRRRPEAVDSVWIARPARPVPPDHQRPHAGGAPDRPDYRAYATEVLGGRPGGRSLTV